jgi:putative salt-induced outer membrane protein YdiY
LHDGIADLDYRLTISPGVGYYLLKETNTTLALETGPAVVIERLGGRDDTYATWRVAERFEHKFASRNTRVWQKLEFLPQLNQLDNYLVNAEVGLEAGITKKASLQAVLQDSYANQPAPGRKANDLKLISGVKYRF